MLERCARASICGRAVRRRHERRRRRRAAARASTRAVIALDMRRMGAGARARPRVADGHSAGRACARPRWSGTLRSARPDARPLPAVVSSTSRSAAARRPARPGRPRAATGAIEKMVLGLRLAAPAGDIAARAGARERGGTGAAPAARRLGGDAGGDRRALAARARGARASASTRASSSRDFAAGVEALRDARPRARDARRGAAVRRAGDAHVARAGRRRRGEGRLGRAYLGLRGHAAARSCLAILGFEGERARSRRRRERALELARRSGGRARSGRSPGRRGLQGRFSRRTCATSC